MGPLRKIVCADGFRKTRFHDEKGNLLPPDQLRHLPRNLVYTTRRLATGRLPELPWITFDAIERLSEVLMPGWRMVEFGSGMSTAWYAGRVAQVHTIEDDPFWYRRVAASAPADVRCELRQGSSYWDLSEYEDGCLDVVVVDGSHRAECVRSALPKLGPGGWLFLDNSDKDMSTGGRGDLRRAEAALFDGVRDRGGHTEQATGLTVGRLIAQQWLLAQLR